MKYALSDKLIAYLTLFSGLTVSAVAVWYSVAGLVAIFAAAAVPIIIMGVALEVSKLVATVWLKLNWQRAPVFIRAYLLTAIVILMLITSMGIFGFLSKAHSDNSLVSGEVQSRIAIYDEQIQTEKENIEAARRALKQMDEGVDQILGRSTAETGASRAMALRRTQQKERASLQAEISQSQKSIQELTAARAPIAAEVRKVEAEVGPIKYIASFIYGEDPEANTLEKAVTWVIVIIVVVFDPLAVILLLASQYSFAWFRKEQQVEELFDNGQPVAQDIDNDTYTAPAVSVDTSAVLQEVHEPLHNAAEDKLSVTESVTLEPPTVHDSIQDVDLPPTSSDDQVEQEDSEILHNATLSEAAAMTAWKQAHPESSLKLQRRMFERGIIKKLPWEDYLAPQLDLVENNFKIVWMENQDGQQVKKVKETYEQNAEQNERTLWQRIQDAKK